MADVMRLEDVLVRAVGLASRGDLQAARALLLESKVPAAAELAGYFEVEQARAEQRTRDMTRFRHEIGNQLSIAKASVEAMRDGIVGVTDSRLDRIRDILTSVSDLMYEATDRAGPLPGAD